jgi:hypothetical protein
MPVCRDETETSPSRKSWRQAASTASLRLLFIFGGWLFDAGVALMALSFSEEWEKTRRGHATWREKPKPTKANLYGVN